MSEASQVKRGLTYMGQERGYYWLWSAVVERMGLTKSNEDIGSDFNVSKDTVRNARLALQAYHALKFHPKYSEQARFLRKGLNKSMWEIVGARFDVHKDVDQLFKDLWSNMELSADDLKRTLREQYDGPELPRLLAKWQKGLVVLKQEMWHHIDGLGQEAPDGLAEQAERVDHTANLFEKELDEFIGQLRANQEPF